MLKAKALCAANGNAAPEIKPLMSVMETPVPAADTHGNGLRDNRRYAEHRDRVGRQ